MPALARRSAEVRGPRSLFTWFTRARAWYVSQPTLIFEAVTSGLALLAGLLVMPALIYVAGQYTLQAYANGGLFTLYRDFFKGLFQPLTSCWVVVFGPLAFLTLLRAFRFISRKL
jgi:hypothetical protein